MGNSSNTNSSDLSDVQLGAATNPNVTPTTLPIRGEKRIIPTPVSAGDLNLAFEAEYLKSGKKLPVYSGSLRNQLVQGSDFNTVAALSPYTDYVIVRLQHRGTSANGQASASL